MKKLYIIFSLILIVSNNSIAQTGSLDNSFSSDGIAYGPFTNGVNHGNAMAIQPDNKIVVTGFLENGGDYDLFVVRYNSDGTIDTSFGNSGSVVQDFNASTDYGNAIAVQPDGKIVVAGEAGGLVSSDFVVVRYTTDGDLDTTFGNAGITLVDLNLNSGDAASCMVLEQTGKIVVAGWTFTNDKDIAVIRLQTDGSLDSTFGTDGIVMTDIDGEYQEANAISLQSDEKIVLTGYTFSSNTYNDAVVVRYNTNGTPDSSFSSTGIAIPGVNANDDDEGNAIAVQNDGKIVIAGHTYNNTTSVDNLIVRLNSNGDRDTTFNSTGIVTSDITGFDNLSTGLHIQQDGKIITTGRAFSSIASNYDFSISRFNSDGSVDLSFGSNGHVLTDIASDIDESFASILQPDGKILLSGYYLDGSVENLVVARYINDSLHTSISETTLDDQLAIFPQPAGNDLSISSADFDKSNSTTFEIYSITGSLLRTIKNQPSILTINVSDLSAGVYFLKVIDWNKNKEVVKRFVKL